MQAGCLVTVAVKHPVPWQCPQPLQAAAIAVMIINTAVMRRIECGFLMVEVLSFVVC